MAKPELRSMVWRLAYMTTIERPDGVEIDMYALHLDPNDDTTAVTIGVPRGREDIADFVIRSCRAGPNVLVQLPLGMKYGPDAAPSHRKN